MHDIDRNSALYKDWEKKKLKPQHHSHADEGKHLHGDHGHSHNHKPHDHHHDHRDNSAHPHDPSYDHDHDTHTHLLQENHDHSHDERSYVNHDRDKHDHDHPPESRFSRDRVFTHLHGHKHMFYHFHHHNHDPAQRNLMHKIFKDPVRDWFGIVIMILMILAGYYHWLPGHLSEGSLVCAAVLGIFPALKNALFDTFTRRHPTFELLISILLIAGLFTGRFLETALISLFLLMGSFMQLNFSWKAH